MPQLTRRLHSAWLPSRRSGAPRCPAPLHSRVPRDARAYDGGGRPPCGGAGVPSATNVWSRERGTITSRAATKATCCRSVIAPNAMAPPAACWRQALARGLQRTQTAASPSPTIVTRTLPGNLGKLHLGAGEPLTQRTPGNGGLRLWRYKTSEAAIDEAQRLGMGMGVKHDVFNTGFAGAKKVCFEDLSKDMFLEVQNETCS